MGKFLNDSERSIWKEMLQKDTVIRIVSEGNKEQKCSQKASTPED